MKQKVLLCVLWGIIGVKMTFVYAPTITEIERYVGEKELKMERELNVVGRKENGKGKERVTAYALFSLTHIAGILGRPLVGGFVKKEGGLAMMGWVLGLLCGASAASSLIWLVGGLAGRRGCEERRW